MFYTVYKITNLINGKFYIGKHQTKDLDDGYMGSGKLLKRAIDKHGIENFKKDILEVYDQEWKMNLAEKVLVVVDPEISYNLCSGGKGGFGYINGSLSIEERKRRAKLGGILSSENRNILTNIKGGVSAFQNSKGFHSLSKDQKRVIHANAIASAKEYSAIEKRKNTFDLIKHQQGSKNSQFGTCWITNGKENRKVKKETLDNLENGWYKGRIKFKDGSSNLLIKINWQSYVLREHMKCVMDT